MIKNFGEATIGLQKILAQCMKLSENLNWVFYCKENQIKLQEKDLLLGDLYTYRTNINSYINDLEYYSEHYLEFDLKNLARTKTYTTDNYFTFSVANKRKRAVEALKVLKQYNNSEIVIERLIYAVNYYIDLCIDILRYNPHLTYFREHYGIEYMIKKYNLYHIEMADI